MDDESSDRGKGESDSKESNEQDDDDSSKQTKEEQTEVGARLSEEMIQ